MGHGWGMRKRVIFRACASSLWKREVSVPRSAVLDLVSSRTVDPVGNPPGDHMGTQSDSTTPFSTYSRCRHFVVDRVIQRRIATCNAKPKRMQPLSRHSTGTVQSPPAGLARPWQASPAWLVGLRAIIVASRDN